MRNSNSWYLKMNLDKPTWHQHRNTLFCTHLGIEVYFEFPENINIELSAIHPDLIRVAEILMFSFKDKTLNKGYEWSRKPIDNGIVGLSYSGGVDSTAALTLLEDVVQPCNIQTFYLQRHGTTFTTLNQTNPLYSVRKIDELRSDCNPTIIIKTNFEKIKHSLHAARWWGYSSDLCVLIGQLLTADLLNINYLSCGMIMESAFFTHDNIYRDFRNDDYWTRNVRLFKRAGLTLFFPTIGCAEFVTNKIADSGRFKGIGMSCVRSEIEGKGCEKCYKCFRKNTLNGILIMNKDAKKQLSKDILKTGMSLMYAYNKYSLNIPEMIKYKGIDFSFLEEYYPLALDCAPECYREKYKQALEKYVNPMTYDMSKFSLPWNK